MSNNIETIVLHGGYDGDHGTMSRAVPVYRTSAYLFKNTEHAANLFALRELGNIYTRIMNPTQDVLEQRLSLMEGGVASLALASGTSAIFYTILNLCSAGDEIISSSNLYGGTYTMFTSILPNIGINVKLVDPQDYDAFKAAITEKTKGIFIETIGNPSLECADIRVLADIAHAARLPLIVDSTFTTPYLLKPIEHGADIVIHSLTKWLGGHGVGIGGIVVDSGKFEWKDNPNFPQFNTPVKSYHGLRWAQDLGDLNPAAFAIRMRVVHLRNLGACISPDNAWMFLQGIETLPLRMQRHCENAQKVAEYLNNHPKVAWVSYPGLPGSATHDLASKYLKKGFGGMVSFGIKGGKEQAVNFIEALQLFSHLANVGDAKSLAIHSASTTHSQLSEDDQRKAGVLPEMIRFSVGLEHIDDIISDIDQAFTHTK